ncbi:MAG: dihydroxyacetone kinase subunit L [Selenomonas sp.]|nr:dihydroxyacetone kinase subunit L [Selenomonas sp.]
MSRIKDAFDAVANTIISQKDYLSSIDAKAGDGDHGFNMARGFTAARDAVDEMEDTSKPGPVLKTIGKALIQNVGGAAGPLYGAAFVKAAEACDDDTAMNKQSFAKLLDAAVKAIQDRGHAQQGDKTILDALIPIRDCFLPENTEDKNLYEVLQEASKAAGDGVSYTKTIPARKGRASLVGERSIGVEDPGAVSTMIMYRALYQFLKY